MCSNHNIVKKPKTFNFKNVDEAFAELDDIGKLPTIKYPLSSLQAIKTLSTYGVISEFMEPVIIEYNLSKDKFMSK
jgi:hypothetical protein